VPSFSGWLTSHVFFDAGVKKEKNPVRNPTPPEARAQRALQHAENTFEL